MSERIRLSAQTRANWIIFAVVFLGGIVASVSGAYYLFRPSGGYEGGRNPLYGVSVLFDRHTWGDLHTWGGILMIAAVVIHLATHWTWVKRMSRRTIKSIRGRGSRLSPGTKFNVGIDLVVGVGFLLTALSGVYFLFAPSGGYQGGANPGWDPAFLFSRTTWDLIHTWSGIVTIVAAVIHLWIHWRWITNVTKRFFLSLGQQFRLAPVRASGAPAAE